MIILLLKLVNENFKALNGEFLKKVDIGGEFTLSFRWLMYGQLKIWTEAQVVAAKNQALAVRTVQNHIYGISMPLNCRVCGMVPEYVDHLLSSCTNRGMTKLQVLSIGAF